MDKEEFIRREREHDETKRRRFLEELEREKEGVNGTKPKGLKEKVSAFREERRYKKYKKAKDKEEREEKVKTKTEIKLFGKKLEEEERQEFEEFKESEREKQRLRRKKVREGLRKAGQYASKVAERAEEITESVDNTSFGKRRDIGDRPRNSRNDLRGLRPGSDPLMEMFTIRPIGADINARPAPGSGITPVTKAGPDPLMDMFLIKPMGGDLLGGPQQQPLAAKKRKAGHKDPLQEFFTFKF